MPKWMQDKKGVDLIKLTIRPLLRTIKKEVNDYYTEHCDPDKIAVDALRIGDRLSQVYDIQKIIDTGKLEQEILKYISPYFDYKRPKEQKLLKVDKQTAVKNTKQTVVKNIEQKNKENKLKKIIVKAKPAK
jgi:hypothetical protein